MSVESTPTLTTEIIAHPAVKKIAVGISDFYLLNDFLIRRMAKVHRIRSRRQDTRGRGGQASQAVRIGARRKVTLGRASCPP